MYDMSEKKRKELEEEIKKREDMTMTFQELSFGEKIRYIWDYYKVPIIATILGLILVISIVSTIVKNLNEEMLLDMTVISTGFEQPIATEITEKWEALLHYDEGRKNQYVLVEHINITEDQDPNAQLTNSSKLTAKLTARMIDLMLMEDSFLFENAENDMYKDLSELLDLEAMGVAKKDWYYANDKVIAINVTENPYFSGLVLSGNDIYIGIYSVAPNTDHALLAIESIYE